MIVWLGAPQGYVHIQASYYRFKPYPVSFFYHHNPVWIFKKIFLNIFTLWRRLIHVLWGDILLMMIQPQTMIPEWLLWIMIWCLFLVTRVCIIFDFYDCFLIPPSPNHKHSVGNSNLNHSIWRLQAGEFSARELKNNIIVLIYKYHTWHFV